MGSNCSVQVILPSPYKCVKVFKTGMLEVYQEVFSARVKSLDFAGCGVLRVKFVKGVDFSFAAERGKGFGPCRR